MTPEVVSSVDVDIHRLTTGGATRGALAGLVLLATFLACLWIATYQEFHAVGFGLIAYRYTPHWTAAVAVGIGGTLLALLIYRQSQRR
jgi:mannose/fructose/N-acetylgalactosamine-specific phosphotransferase system component IIC